ncbi:MAG: SMI1/KNR4 family protein [Planctomycetales bacterium]
MTTAHWQELYDSLVVKNHIGDPHPLPTDEDCDRFEQESGLRLPSSYRAFIKVFGPGVFGCSLEITAPMSCNERWDLAEANRGYQMSPTEWGRVVPAKADLGSRLFFFGCEEEQDPLAWDPQDVRDAEGSEYAIYRLTLDDLEFVAASFRELVDAKCEQMFAPDPKWDEAELGPQRLFWKGSA